MTAPSMRFLGLAAAFAPLAGCAALREEPPSRPLPVWFQEAAPAARAQGYPDLTSLEGLDAAAAPDAERARLEQELRRTAETVLADPRGVPGDAGNVAQFIDEARRAVTPPAPPQQD